MSMIRAVRGRMHRPMKIYGKAKGARAAVVALAFLLAVVLTPYSPLAADGDFVCNNSFGAPITSGTFGNIVVPPGDNCVMYGHVIIRGNVKVEAGSELHLFGGVAIAGNLQSDGANHIAINPGCGGKTICGGTSNVIRGNVETSSTENTVSLTSLVVGGNVKIDDTGGLITLMANSLVGNVGIQDGMGGATINQNVVLGNLDCQNIASPFTLGTNLVAGNTSGQCE
jgi:hypothetical protein